MSIVAMNAKNQIKGKVKNIIAGPVVSEVDVETAAGILSSIVTSSSVKDLNLEAGTDVLVVFKATEVLLAKVGP